MNKLPWPVMLAPLLAFAPTSARGQSAGSMPAAHDAVAIVTHIVRADYEGDRAALRRLHAELAALPEDPARASRLHYWRGFALWRRVINGVNDKVDVKEQEQDLNEALRELEEAKRRDPTFADADVGIASCLQILGFLNRGNSDRIAKLLPRYIQQLKSTAAAAPDNPRLLWVLGSSEWYAPPGSSPEQTEQRQLRALATYQRGLELIRKQKTTPARDPLDPMWGEPELLMSLAWSHVNRTTPDPEVAERYAKDAVALVPHWHYVRDILMPQIQDAKRKVKP